MSIFISCEAEASPSIIISNNIRSIKSRIANINLRDYTDTLDDMGIIINCFTEKLMKQGLGKPRKYISYKNRTADIRLPIEYDYLLSSDRDTQRLIIVKNITESVNTVKVRLDKKKLRFDSKLLIADLLHCLDINFDELENVRGYYEPDTTAD